jgi:dihydrofolate synthase/folylpolyglutamate synthase
MPHTLEQWLAYIEATHPSEIELGLDRIRAVARELGADRLPCPVVTVAGTNGKGSMIALAEALAASTGARVAVYTSPHLHRFNERIRIGGVEADDATLCAAFEAVDQARLRADTSLTYFEFATLAAFHIFARQRPDLCLLEVGLGGRLDAVNIIDPTVSVITSVGLDHTDWLGDDRESIAVEKAGIARPDTPLLYGEEDMPSSVADTAARVGARLMRAGDCFGTRGDSVYWLGNDGTTQLAIPRIPLGADNLATALQALALAVPGCQPPAPAAVAASLQLSGRAEHCPLDAVDWFLDVGHNEEALSRFLERLPPVNGRTLAVAAMLVDKPAERALARFVPLVADWYLAGLPGRRGGTAATLRAALPADARARAFDTVTDAVNAARAAAQPGDRVLVFGSFITVAQAREALAAFQEQG